MGKSYLYVWTLCIYLSAKDSVQVTVNYVPNRVAVTPAVTTATTMISSLSNTPTSLPQRSPPATTPVHHDSRSALTRSAPHEVIHKLSHASSAATPNIPIAPIITSARANPVSPTRSPRHYSPRSTHSSSLGRSDVASDRPSVSISSSGIPVTPLCPNPLGLSRGPPTSFSSSTTHILFSTSGADVDGSTSYHSTTPREEPVGSQFQPQSQSPTIPSRPTGLGGVGLTEGQQSCQQRFKTKLGDDLYK